MSFIVQPLLSNSPGHGRHMTIKNRNKWCLNENDLGLFTCLCQTVRLTAPTIQLSLFSDHHGDNQVDRSQSCDALKLHWRQQQCLSPSIKPGLNTVCEHTVAFGCKRRHKGSKQRRSPYNHLKVLQVCFSFANTRVSDYFALIQRGCSLNINLFNIVSALWRLFSWAPR